MDFARVPDYDNAPEIFVTNVSRISRITHGVVRETYFSQHADADGKPELRTVVHLLWDLESLREYMLRLEAAAPELALPPVPPDDGGRRAMAN